MDLEMQSDDLELILDSTEKTLQYNCYSCSMSYGLATCLHFHRLTQHTKDYLFSVEYTVFNSENPTYGHPPTDRDVEYFDCDDCCRQCFITPDNPIMKTVSINASAREESVILMTCL